MKDFMAVSCDELMSRLGFKMVGLKYVTKIEKDSFIDKVRVVIVGLTFLFGSIAVLSGAACFYSAVVLGCQAISGAICMIVGEIMLALAMLWMLKMSGFSICG